MSLRPSNPFANVIMELLDRVECLYMDVKNGNMLSEAIDGELASIIRMLGVNLRTASLGISSLKEIRDVVEYGRSILILAYNKDLITDEIFQKNVLSLSKVLKSCETLPNSFVNDLILSLDDILKMQAESVNSLD